jgi:hypothetical protein
MQGTTVVDIKQNILRFHADMLDDPYHRYRSWEHCFRFFRTLQHSRDEKAIDTATLHLAFYLASWGMYRGSSQLLQKDYRVHSLVVRELLQEKYSGLWRIDLATIDYHAPEVSLVMQLAGRLGQTYLSLGISPTPTLVTKVLLGTYACIPAYDTLFLSGVAYWNKLPESHEPKFPAWFGINSYRGLLKFYRSHKQDFDMAQETIAKGGMVYPPMKLADMYFWNLGSQLGR